jgi:serine/threonine protein kinase
MGAESAATGESGSVSGSAAASAEEADGGSQARRFDQYEVMLNEAGRPIELGRGAMGVTYKALDVDLRYPVTLKVISERYLGDESAQLRFLREARAAASVRHPNVASVFHLGRTGSSYFYAMEFVEGETLEHLIRRSGRVKVKMALEIMAQVVAGLAAVHEQNLVHRDIKPSNILVRLKDDGSITAKIIDLGLAKAVNEPSDQTAISTPGAFAGTPEFASPEQFAGIGADIRSDLYSLGITLWEMVTGRTPFRGTPGLCVVTTRTQVGDIANHEASSALRHDLDQLSSDAGAQLLRALGVKGYEAELRSASDEFSGHSLALTLLGSYLSDAYDGDIRRRSEVSGHLADDLRQGIRARKVMESYETWFGEGPELSVLRMLGLFDRPAEGKALGVLLKPPAIPGLTQSLTDLSPTQKSRTPRRTRPTQS